MMSYIIQRCWSASEAPARFEWQCDTTYIFVINCRNIWSVSRLTFVDFVLNRTRICTKTVNVVHEIPRGDEWRGDDPSDELNERSDALIIGCFQDERWFSFSAKKKQLWWVGTFYYTLNSFLRGCLSNISQKLFNRFAFNFVCDEKSAQSRIMFW